MEHLWINLDGELKTRTWAEVEQALENMVSTTAILRGKTAAPAA